ncbi:hypothetical protein ACLKA6_001715 [Drosophila palustris]
MCFRRCRWRNRVHYSVPAATPTLAGLQALAAPPAAPSLAVESREAAGRLRRVDWLHFSRFSISSARNLHPQPVAGCSIECRMQYAGHQLHIASELNCHKQLLLPLALPLSLASTRHAFHSAPYADNLQCQK